MAQETLTYSSTVSDDTGTGPSRVGALDGAAWLIATVGHAAIIELTNLTGNVGTINWIQHTIHGNGIAGKTTADGKVFILNDSNTELYADTHTFNPPGIQTYTGTQRTTSNGSDAWTESDINALRLKIKFEAESAANDLAIDFVKITVDYDLAPTIPPLQLTSGLVKITSGLIKIS